MLLGEIPAAAPAVEGIAALFLLLAFVVCIGLQKAWRHTIGWVFVKLASELGAIRLPSIIGGGRIFAPVVDFLNSVNDSVEHALAVSALKTEAGAVWLFSVAAHQLAWMSRELHHLATATLHAIEHAGGAVKGDAAKLTHAVEQRLERSVRRAEAAAIHELTQLEHLVARRLHALEHSIAVALPRDIATVFPRLDTLDREWHSIRRRVGRLERLLAEAGLVALIGATIYKLLPDFIRCPSFGRFGNRVGCGGFQLLTDLLEATFVGFAVTDLCDFAAAAGWTAHELSPLLAELVVVEDALVGCHGATAPPLLPLPALSLPPATIGLQLAA